MYITWDKHKALIAVGVVLAAILLASCAREEVVSQNVWAFGVPLGGLPKQEAINVIEEKVSEIQQGPLLFKAGDMTCEVLPEDLRVVPDTGQIAKQLEDYIDSRSKQCLHLFSEKCPRQSWRGLPI